MTEINIQIRDADTFEHQGKTYRAVAFYRPFTGDVIVGGDGTVMVNKCGKYDHPRLIVEEVKPLHRTPTDEDAKRRPACECRDIGAQFWNGSGDHRLIYVGDDGRFLVLHPDGEAIWWSQCRIPNET